MGASVHGWKFCRPDIPVDETFLKVKSHETLQLATTQDGDNHLFPMALVSLIQKTTNLDIGS